MMLGMNNTWTDRTVALLALALLATPGISPESVGKRAFAQDSSPDAATELDTAYTAGEFRVFTGSGDPATLEDIVAAMSGVSVVFIGETHDDPTQHMIEAELLRRAYAAWGDPEARGQESRPVTLSLEFFQRDTQPILDEYLAGLISEKSFTDAARPWPRYETDYRPLIEFSRQHQLRVIAANAPRRYASRVTREGRESLAELPPHAFPFLPPLPYGKASESYRRQWIEVISEVMEQEGKKCGIPIEQLRAEGEEAHARAPEGAHGNMGNQLDSQVLWDASMAYWISRYLAEQPDALVLHMVGGFHVERGTGTPEHLEAYRPGTRRLIIAMQPVQDNDAFEPAPEGEWDNFVIQTDVSRTLEEIQCRRFLADREAKSGS
jgi:uncharacterized iron-regulated protein